MMSGRQARKLIGSLKPADVVMVSEKGLQHTVNRWLQRSKWHHVMLYIGKGYTMEVNPRNGSHRCDLIHDLTEKPYSAIKVVRNKSLSGQQRMKVVKTAKRLFSGEKFSWLQYAKIILGRTLNWKMNGDRSLVCKPGFKCNTRNVACSNMVAMAYYEAGFPISDRYMPEYVVPKDYEKAKKFTVVIDKAFP